MDSQFQLMRRLNEADNLNDVIEFVVSTAKEFTGGDDASLLMWDAETDSLTSIVTKGTHYYEVPPGVGITRRALRTERIQRVPDVNKDPAYFKTKANTQSEIVVPLIYKGKGIGVLDVQSTTLGNFTEVHEDFLKVLAEHISAVLEKFRRVEEAESLRKVQSAISNGVELEGVVQLVLEQAAELTGAENAWLRVVNKHSKKLVIEHALDGNLSRFTDHDIHQDIIGENISLREPYLCSNISKDSTYPGPFKKGCDLTVPIFSEREVIGVICVWSPHPNVFDQEHVRRLSGLAYQAGVAIERANLLKTIANIASQIGKLDEAAFLRYLTDAIQEIFKPESHCTIWFYSAAEDCLYHKDVGIPDDPFVGCPQLPMTGLSGEALRGKKPIAVTDIFADGRHYFKNIARMAGFKSVLSIPILIGEQPLGVFNVHTFALHQFKNLEINLLSAFAGYAAVAIENARNLERLAAEDRAKSELIRVFAHELKMPLSHFQFYMYRWQKAKDLPAKYRKEVATFYPYFERQNRLIDKVTTFAKMKRGEIQPVKANIELNDLLKSVVEVYQFAAKEEEVVLQYREVSGEIPVYVDPDLIARVFDNLIDNAITFTPEDGTVSVHLTEDAEAVQIAVSDTGIGISEANQEHIFEDFYSGDPSRGLEGGMGIGLYLVKKIIENGHGGTITVDSKLGEGSTFTVTLPKGEKHE